MKELDLSTISKIELFDMGDEDRLEEMKKFLRGLLKSNFDVLAELLNPPGESSSLVGRALLGEEEAAKSVRYLRQINYEIQKELLR